MFAVTIGIMRFTAWLTNGEVSCAGATTGKSKRPVLLSCECDVLTRVMEAGGSLVMIGELEGAFQGAHEVQAGGQLVGPHQAV